MIIDSWAIARASIGYRRISVYSRGQKQDHKAGSVVAVNTAFFLTDILELKHAS